MGRLIDEDMLMERLGFLNTPQEREENAGQIITLEDFDSIPTAYDVDKVVEKLEKQSKPLGIGFIPDERYIKEKKAIEIVKQCGVADDVCEWKEDAYGRWHTECNMLADNNPLEYTYCPYCRKKIKVVDDDKIRN